MLTSLVLLATLAFSNPMDRLSEKYCVSADQLPIEEVEMFKLIEQKEKYVGLAELNTNIHLRGRVKKTTVWLIQNKVAGVSLLLDPGEPSDHMYRHSYRVYRWLNKVYGQAIETDNAFVWLSGQFMLGLGNVAGSGMTLYLQCGFEEE